MEIRTATTITEIEAPTWDALHDGRDPFLRHAFLRALETNDCLHPQGWHPLHLLAYDGGMLAGVLPLYLRDNSFGEFVFDWAWAEAYQRAGGAYYPKLVTAIPFVPATGERFLIHQDANAELIVAALHRAAIDLTERRHLSSWHCLFPEERRARELAEHGLSLRYGCQYHWFNRGYRDFDEFLAGLNAKRRKQIRRERREIAASGLVIETRTGARMDARLWSIFHQFYCATFARRWGAPRLTESFFNELGRTMPDETLVILARDGDTYVAGAFAVRGKNTLYGRHWGCSRDIPFLHFELCYYRTIDYCITQGLERMDAGAQGEHKIPRGFEPVTTYSAHYIREPGFRRAVDDFLGREAEAMRQRVHEIEAHSPYRAPGSTPEAPQ